MLVGAANLLLSAVEASSGGTSGSSRRSAASAWNSTAAAGLIAASTSYIDFFGHETECDPVPEAAAKKAQAFLGDWLTPALLDSAVSQHVRHRTWCAVRAQKTIHVTVMGASVTVGCGAEHPSIRCHTRWSWSRHLRDRLSAMLGHAGHPANVQVHVYGKNAVESTFFSQCTKTRFQLSANTSVVLVELEAAYQAGGAHAIQSLRTLLSRVRRGAPHAALGFIAWPSMYGSAAALENALKNASGMHGELYDVALATPLLQASTSGAKYYYSDAVHPNLAGHTLLGTAAAYMISKGILDMRCDAAGHSSTQHRAHAHAAAEMSTSAAVANSTADQHPGSSALNNAFYEQCMGSADELPVVQPLDGWVLHDEGLKKGVRKLGYVSNRVGAKLSIGPLLPDIRCGFFDVSLGYLQSWRPEMGSLRISCSGCKCAGIPGEWSKGAFPYPTVQTWSYATAPTVVSERNKQFQKDFAPTANASLTVSTRFAIFKKEGPCYVNVTHEKGRRAPPANRTSRVRVDSIGIELASCMMSCHFSKYPWSKNIATQGRMCATGQDQGLAGYVSPACFNNGTQTCRLAMVKDTTLTY